MENKTYKLLLLFVFVLLVRGQDENECYTMTFDGSNYAIFEANYNYTDTLDVGLSFKTSQENGLIFYKEGEYNLKMPGPHDYEGLFIRNGTLNYFVFNPNAIGAGGTYGCHVKTDFDVSNDTWFEVEFFRNRKVERNNNHGKVEYEKITGMVVNGQSFLVESYHSFIGQLDLQLYTWIGGFTEMDRLGVEKFDGTIKNFRDLSTQQLFPKSKAMAVGSPTMEEMTGTCLEVPEPS